jgi:hypothetical protein
MPPDIKGFVRSESREEIVAWSFQLNRTVGKQQERSFFWLSDDSADRVPMRVGTGTSEVGKRFAGRRLLSRQ